MKAFVLLLLSLFNSHTSANTAVAKIDELLNQNQQQLQKVKSEFKDYYFLYVFKSTCPHCHKFTPLIQDLTEHLKLTLQAYSIDGATIDSLLSEPITPQLFDTLFTSAGFKPVVPALFLANKETGQVYAVSFGETNAIDLASRLNELLTTIKGRFDA